MQENEEKSLVLDDDTQQMINESEGPTTSPPPTGEPELTKRRNVGFNRKTLMTIIFALMIIAGGVIAYIMQKNSQPVTSDSNLQTDTVVTRFGVAVGLVEGKVEYAEANSSEYKTLDANVELTEGMQVRTGGDGRVVLLIDDGSAVRLSYSSEINLKSLDTNDVRIDNLNGEVYSRVAKADDRRYAVYVEGDLYEAKGTAFRTFSKLSKKGVEVYHSSVEALNKDTVISEGSAYLTLSEQKEKENIISQIDLEALKNDEFIKWNADQDKKNSEYADKLGVLIDIDKIVETPPPPPPKPSVSAGIVLKGSQSEYSAVFSWTVTDVDVSNGFKLVRSKTSKTPTYPENSVVYIEAGKKSYTLFDGDGNTYYYRLCAYREGKCSSYSNAVSVGTKKKEKPVVESGAVNLSISGSTLSWTFAGTAPYGFKVVVGTASNPTYESNIKKLYTDGLSVDLAGELDAGTYYVRVCKYTDGGCQDYSNEVMYTKP
jgi:hypothetical protein